MNPAQIKSLLEHPIICAASEEVPVWPSGLGGTTTVQCLLLFEGHSEVYSINVAIRYYPLKGHTRKSPEHTINWSDMKQIKYRSKNEVVHELDEELKEAFRDVEASFAEACAFNFALPKKRRKKKPRPTLKEVAQIVAEAMVEQAEEAIRALSPANQRRVRKNLPRVKELLAEMLAKKPPEDNDDDGDGLDEPIDDRRESNEDFKDRGLYDGGVREFVGKRGPKKKH